MFILFGIMLLGVVATWIILVKGGITGSSEKAAAVGFVWLFTAIITIITAIASYNYETYKIDAQLKLQQTQTPAKK